MVDQTDSNWWRTLRHKLEDDFRQDHVVVRAVTASFSNRMDNVTTIVGVLAAICTTASYLPQVHKTWRTRQTEDLSLRMLLLLAAGLSLWILYGVLNGDIVIILANTVSLGLLGSIIFWKLREG